MLAIQITDGYFMSREDETTCETKLLRTTAVFTALTTLCASTILTSSACATGLICKVVLMANATINTTTTAAPGTFNNAGFGLLAADAAAILVTSACLARLFYNKHQAEMARQSAADVEAATTSDEAGYGSMQ